MINESVHHLVYFCQINFWSKALILKTTDKETDESWDIYIVWKIISGLWAGLDCEKKRFWPIMSDFWGPFFHSRIKFAQKIDSKYFWKYCRVCIENLHRIKVNKSEKKIGKHFYGKNPVFFRAKNLSVNTKTLWSVLSLLLLCLKPVWRWIAMGCHKCVNNPKQRQKQK